jgi:hypothetical protein
MVVHTCNPITQEIKGGGSQIHCHPGLHIEKERREKNMKVMI